MKRFLLSVALLLACSGVAFAQESEFSGGGGGGVSTAGGSGTAGRIPQFASATSVLDSKMTASGTNSGTWTLYDSTGGAGVTSLVVRAGDNQLTTPLGVLYANDGTTARFTFGSTGILTATVDTAVNDLAIKAGRAGNPNAVLIGDYGYGNSGEIQIGNAGGYSIALYAAAGIALGSTTPLEWSPNPLFVGNPTDTGIIRDGIGIIAVTDGSTGQGGIGRSDAATNTVTDALILRHATSGTAAAGFGTGLLFQGEDAAGNMQDMASLQAVYSDATNASEDADLRMYGIVAGALTRGPTLSAAVRGSNPGLQSHTHMNIEADGQLYLGGSGAGAYDLIIGNYSVANYWKFEMDSSGEFAPILSNTYDIGTSSAFVRNNYVSTSIQGTRTKTLTDNTITDVVQISSATTDRVTAGHVSYTVYASDATNHLVQTETGEVPFLLVNENGTVTVTLGTVYGTAIDSAGGAALTNTFASSVSGTDAKIRVTSNYDQATLTGTVTHTIEYRVYIDSGTATVTPQ